MERRTKTFLVVLLRFGLKFNIDGFLIFGQVSAESSFGCYPRKRPVDTRVYWKLSLVCQSEMGKAVALCGPSERDGAALGRRGHELGGLAVIKMTILKTYSV